MSQRQRSRLVKNATIMRLTLDEALDIDSYCQQRSVFPDYSTVVNSLRLTGGLVASVVPIWSVPTS